MTIHQILEDLNLQKLEIERQRGVFKNATVILKISKDLEVIGVQYRVDVELPMTVLLGNEQIHKSSSN